MGMRVNVYRAAGRLTDCTAGGISAQADELCIVNVDGPFEPGPKAPAALLMKHAPFGDVPGKAMAIVVPAEPDGNGGWRKITRVGPNMGPTPRYEVWTMFGGNYAGTSDGRWSEAVEKVLGVEQFHGAVAVHDRIEG